MNVTSIGQGGGSVVTLPRLQPDTEVQPQSLRAGPQQAPNTEPQPESTPVVEPFVRVGWFDLNGDGRIDGRSSLSGGDGVLLLPAHAVDAPRYARIVGRAAARAADSHEEPVSDPPKSDAQSVQTRQAIDAYQRYGQTPDATTDQAVA
ncbi:MAG TPA: hypothetical protein VFR41_03825 [Acidimicrobiia bacterium]|nr:hypothetical protein [Acidimicrobiia bacterium]